MSAAGAPPAGASLELARGDGLLLDIEGTLAPIAFVHEVMFPFARARLASAIARRAEDPRLASACARLEEERAAAPEPARGDDLAAFARGLIDRDVKSTGLKSLQGVIWEEGFLGGTLVAPVYPDVPAALDGLLARGVRARIYSSGSVLAQRLFFAHTDHGDLTSRFEGFHDTETGPKREARSYEAIARAFDLAPARILFLSDVVAELDAARAAGLRTALVRRPGNPPAERGAHPVLESLAPLCG